MFVQCLLAKSKQKLKRYEFGAKYLINLVSAINVYDLELVSRCYQLDNVTHCRTGSFGYAIVEESCAVPYHM